MLGHYCCKDPQKGFFQDSSEIPSYSFLTRNDNFWLHFFGIYNKRNIIVMFLPWQLKMLQARNECFSKNNPFTFLILKSCDRWMKPNIRISLRLQSDSIDWFYLISLNLYSKQLDYLIELEVNRKYRDNLALWKVSLPQVSQ